MENSDDPLGQQLIIEAIIDSHRSAKHRAVFITVYKEVRAYTFFLYRIYGGNIENAPVTMHDAILDARANFINGKYKPTPSGPVGYIKGFIKIKWKNDLRKSKSMKRKKNIENELPAIYNTFDSTEDKIKKDENLALLYKGLAQLPNKQKAILEAFYLDKKSMKEIGDELGIKENTAKQRKFVAIRKLREWIKINLNKE